MTFMDYKYVIVGAGFLGATIAERIANELEKPVLLVEKRNHIGGNCYSEIDSKTGIEYHSYGTHIFHCSDLLTWEYINRFTTFNSYYHQVLTTFKGKVYQMPINLETINSYYNLNLKPWQVDDFLKKEIEKSNITSPKNFEEKAISLIGAPLYEAFIKGYTIKQWQKNPTEIPAEILMRLPFRKNYNESYYNDNWQGIPTDGYTAIFVKMLKNPLINLQLNTDFFEIKNQLSPQSTIIYSGPLDRYFDYCYGKLDWRTLKFEFEYQPYEDFQGTSVMNYADVDIPYTRIHKPRHLHPDRKYPSDKTITIKEYSLMDDGTSPYYPINDKKNNSLLKKYQELTYNEKNIFFAGRLGGYKYLDMHHTIAMALELFNNKIKPYAV